MTLEGREIKGSRIHDDSLIHEEKLNLHEGERILYKAEFSSREAFLPQLYDFFQGVIGLIILPIKMAFEFAELGFGALLFAIAFIRIAESVDPKMVSGEFIETGKKLLTGFLQEIYLSMTTFFLVMGWIALARAAYRHAVGIGNEYIVTNKRIILKLKTGLLSYKTVDFYLKRAESIRYRQSHVERRFLNSGSVTISGSGNRISLNMVPRFDEFKRVLEDAVHKEKEKATKTNKANKRNTRSNTYA